MKRLTAVSAAAFLLVICVSSAVADIKLPAPKTEGGMGLFEALKKRASAPGGDFPSGDLSDEELSNVLWAATGLNRGQKGWTVPMDRGLPPYVNVYAARRDGVFLYDWGANTLREITKKDIRPDMGLQSFVAGVPCSLIFVADGEALAEFSDEILRTQFADVAAGAMTQNAYLACAAMGLGARYIHSIKENEIRSALGLPDEDRVICIFMLGK
ncbi:MAG: nitroreductase family protein [Synergistaceae bacterium]|jgi:nitroreductase|nr:nitroreductase family protein [Synergistaceae bacterium]